MYTRIGRQLSFCLLAAVLLSTTPAVIGVERSVNRTALDLVQEALHREVFSMQEERDRLLAAAEQEQPDLPEVKWHRGQVNVRGSWVSIDDIPGLLQGDTTLAKYERIRAVSRDSLQGHMALASWCAKNGLVDQQRAHLERVLDTLPEHPQARALLGHWFIQGDWRSPSEQEDLARTEEMLRDAMSRCRSKIEGIRKLLNENSPSKQQHAAKQLNAIYELEVVPVLEEVLAYDSSVAAMLVVDWLSNHSEQPAVAALMRQSVLSPWIEVRHRAASELGKREAVRFVPAMVAELATPVSMQFAFTPTRRLDSTWPDANRAGSGGRFGSFPGRRVRGAGVQACPANHHPRPGTAGARRSRSRELFGNAGSSVLGLRRCLAAGGQTELGASVAYGRRRDDGLVGPSCLRGAHLQLGGGRLPHLFRRKKPCLVARCHRSAARRRHRPRDALMDAVQCG